MASRHYVSFANTYFHGYFLIKIFLAQKTVDIFETGSYGVPSKLQNPTVLGQSGPSSTQCSNPSWACRVCNLFGTNNYPPFRHRTQNQIFILTLYFFIFY